MFIVFVPRKHAQVLRELKAAPRPHTLEFLRYDMNFNRLTLKWETLEDVRQQGKYVRDAREEVRERHRSVVLFQKTTVGHSSCNGWLLLYTVCSWLWLWYGLRASEPILFFSHHLQQQ